MKPTLSWQWKEMEQAYDNDSLLIAIELSIFKTDMATLPIYPFDPFSYKTFKPTCDCKKGGETQ